MATQHSLPGCVLLASGHSRRFGQDKLLYPIEGTPLLQRACSCVPKNCVSPRIAVVRSHEAFALCADAGFQPLLHDGCRDDIAYSIHLGVSALPAGVPGCMFLVADQPWLSQESVKRLVESFRRCPQRIHALSFAGRRGNPVIFPGALFPELAMLSPGESGRTVLRRHETLLTLVSAMNAQELLDVDTPADLFPDAAV